MIDYASILQTGIQSLLAVACGWGCGRWGVLQPDATVAQVNTLVLKFCIPCLQVWLLAIKTDMRQPGSWSALLAFLTWSMGLQGLLALWQLLRQGRLHYAQLGVNSLLLTTNNTGILGPVVLLAALGPDYAPLGMLTTVALYFQQLPSAQLLFQLHKAQTVAASRTTAAVEQTADVALSSVATVEGDGIQQQLQQWQPEQEWQEQRSLLAPVQPGCQGGCSTCSTTGMLADSRSDRALDEAASQQWNGGTAKLSAAIPVEVTAAAVHGRCASSVKLQPLQRHCGSADSLQQLHHVQQQHQYVVQVSQYDLQQQNHQQQQQHSFGRQKHQGSASLAASLLLKNPLVWSTGLSLLLSCMGSSVLLDPSSPVALQQLSFIDGLLGWFAATTAPLTLFTTGLWMYSNRVQQQYRVEQLREPSLIQWQEGQERVHVAAQPTVQQQQQQLTWRQLWMYLVARATLAPGLMVLVCWAMGFQGDLAHALVILALLPVAQTAFVVCKQAEVGTYAVSVMMVASLLVMLPQLMVLLALLEWLGVFA